MKGEKAVEIFELAKQGNRLPEKMEDLVPLSFIGQSAVAFYRQKIKLMDQLKMTEEQRKATLSDGQDAGEMLLDIEMRIGEICLKEPSMAGRESSRRESILEEGSKIKPKHERIGLKTFSRVSEAQRIAQHPEAVKYVIKKAKENEDIPTKTAVLSEIKFRKSLEPKPIVPKEPKPRPKIDEFVDETTRQIGDLVSSLFKLVGNIHYIESELIKEAFKINLDELSKTIEKIKKEI